MTGKDYLEHFGILGMKWGKKKNKNINISDDHKVKNLIKQKNLKELSNSEIKKINERIQLEKQYKELTKETKSAGRKFVEELLTNQAKEFAANYVRKQLTKLAERGSR